MQITCTGLIASIALLFAAISSLAQSPATSPAAAPPQSAAEADQTATALGLNSLLEKIHTLQSARSCDAAPGMEELARREELLESIATSSLEIDSVLAEISNERTDLAELRASLESRRDRTVGLLNAANLITGTGLGIAVNAMQFSTSTANLGDGIGVGSGIASTILSIVGIRKQNGPLHGVGDVPNMLAPLFDAKPVLNTYYPPEVIRYLNDAPPGQTPEHGTRLAQLMQEWTQAGRLDAPGSPKRQQKIDVLTASMSKTAKVSIGDLTDRSAMLGDVAGRVALMKRDMATMMRSVPMTPAACHP